MSNTCEHNFVEWRGREICEECGMTDFELEHDHLCVARNKNMIKSSYCTFCQLIRKVREEERQKLENS